MHIYELPDGRVVTTGSFDVAEWEAFRADHAESKRPAAATPKPASGPASGGSGANAETTSKTASAKGAKG